MFEIRDLYRTLSGREISADIEQRLLAFAAKSNIPMDDAMFAITVILEASFGLLRDFPADAAYAAREGAKAAADGAGSLAEARIIQAVDRMLPSVSEKVAAAAALATMQAIQPMRLQASLISIIVFSCVVALATLASMSTTLSIVQSGGASNAIGPLSWKEVEAAIGAGLAFPLASGIGLSGILLAESALATTVSMVIAGSAFLGMVFLFFGPLFGVIGFR